MKGDQHREIFESISCVISGQKLNNLTTIGCTNCDKRSFFGYHVYTFHKSWQFLFSLFHTYCVSISSINSLL